VVKIFPGPQREKKTFPKNFSQKFSKGLKEFSNEIFPHGFSNPGATGGFSLKASSYSRSQKFSFSSKEKGGEFFPGWEYFDYCNGKFGNGGFVYGGSLLPQRKGAFRS